MPKDKALQDLKTIEKANAISYNENVLHFDGVEFKTSKYLFSKGIIVCVDCGRYMPYEYRFCDDCKKYVIFIIS